MASMYDNVSLSGLIDTAAGNYQPNQNKSTLNALYDAGKSVGQGISNAYNQVVSPLNKDALVATQLGVVGPAANAISDTMAERDYAAEHGGQMPASPEELSAYKSLKAKDMSGALSQPQTPADESQDKQQEVQQGVQNAEQQQADLASKGYKDVPDPAADPVGHMASRNSNMSKSVGGTGGVADLSVPTPPTQKQAQGMQLNQVGKQASFDQNKIPAWYKSDSFNMGLISFGLNLLSGNDLATSFGAAGQAFNDMYGREKRGYWTQDLIKQGYDPIEVDEWQRTGNSKVLTSPQDKQMKNIQQQMQMQQLDNAMYEGSPEMRQYRLDQDKFQRNMQVQQLNDARAARADNLQLRRMQMSQMAEDRNFRRQMMQQKMQQDQGKYQDGLAKAEHQYTLIRQGGKNYDETVKNYGGINNIYSKNAVGQLGQAGLTDMTFSGNATKEALARQMDEKFVTTVNREREWLAPLLRKNSGSAITQGEWKTTGEVFFPRPGDTQQSINQKAQSRVVAELSMDPHASGAIRQAVSGYTTGDIDALKMSGGRVYAQQNGQWYEVPQ